mmetsp:Transcript_3470/g.6319  ORF Transcript_3470/g.6319 Transcript_3470/m.6319 type:complete len:201 (+) Transcript_3470:1418-2020(+)
MLFVSLRSCSTCLLARVSNLAYASSGLVCRVMVASRNSWRSRGRWRTTRCWFSAITSAARSKNACCGLQYSRSRLPKVSGGAGGFCSRKFSLRNPAVGSSSMLISALLCSVTASSSCSLRGGRSVSASLAATKFLRIYSMAAFKLNASTSAVSRSVWLFPTLRTSIPSVEEPTESSGCSRTPRSMISASCFSAGPYCLVL